MMERFRFAEGYTISRLIKGGWHLAGGHGAIDERQAIRDMAAFVDAGITTFDCADIYTGVESLIGEFRRQYPVLSGQVQVHTKFVPDLDRLSSITPEYVRGVINRSLQRLRCEQLDLVQFHWWDFEVAGYVEAALELEALRREGKIARVGVTNFDTDRLDQLVSAGVRVSAHQLQYSLLDARPEHRMIDYCDQHQIAVLCYGTVAGGFLSERWIGKEYPVGDLTNRSLVKYRLIIDEFGGWELFQHLLGVLGAIGQRHGVDIATVATKAILQNKGVAAAIVGATNASHLTAHESLTKLHLNDADLQLIKDVTVKRKGPYGDVYALERDREGPHGRIMKYNLSQGAEK